MAYALLFYDMMLYRILFLRKCRWFEAMRDGAECETEIVLPVELIKRESTREL